MRARLLPSARRAPCAEVAAGACEICMSRRRGRLSQVTRADKQSRTFRLTGDAQIQEAATRQIPRKVPPRDSRKGSRLCAILFISFETV